MRISYIMRNARWNAETILVFRRAHHCSVLQLFAPDTPVFPPAWLDNEGLWMVFTQCCGNPRPPLNHYNFNAQRVDFQYKE